MRKIAAIQSIIILFLLSFISLQAQPPAYVNFVEGESSLTYTVKRPAGDNAEATFHFEQPKTSALLSVKVGTVLYSAVDPQTGIQVVIPAGTGDVKIVELYDETKLTPVHPLLMARTFVWVSGQKIYKTNLFWERMRIKVNYSTVSVNQEPVYRHEIEISNNKFSGILYAQLNFTTPPQVVEINGTATDFAPITFQEGKATIDGTGGYFGEYNLELYTDEAKTDLLYTYYNAVSCESFKIEDFFYYVNIESFAQDGLLHYEFILSDNSQGSEPILCRFQNNIYPIKNIKLFDRDEVITVEKITDDTRNIPFSENTVDGNIEYLVPFFTNKKILVTYQTDKELPKWYCDKSFQYPWGASTIIVESLALGSECSKEIDLEDCIWANFEKEEVRFDRLGPCQLSFSAEKICNHCDPNNFYKSVGVNSTEKGNEFVFYYTIENKSPYPIDIKNLYFKSYDNEDPVPFNDIIISIGNLELEYYYSVEQNEYICNLNNEVYPYFVHKVEGHSSVIVKMTTYLPKEKIDCLTYLGIDFDLNDNEGADLSVGNFIKGNFFNYKLSESACGVVTIESNNIINESFIDHVQIYYVNSLIPTVVNGRVTSLSTSGVECFDLIEIPEEINVPLRIQRHDNTYELKNGIDCSDRIVVEITLQDGSVKEEYFLFNINKLTDQQLSHVYPPYEFTIDDTEIVAGKEANLRSAWDYTTDFEYAYYYNTGNDVMSPGDSPTEIIPENISGNKLGLQLAYEYEGDECYTYAEADVALSRAYLELDGFDPCKNQEYTAQLYINGYRPESHENIKSIYWTMTDAAGNDISDDYIANRLRAYPLFYPSPFEATLSCDIEFLDGTEPITTSIHVPSVTAIESKTVTNTSCQSTPDGSISIVSYGATPTFYDNYDNELPAEISGSNPYTTTVSGLELGFYHYSLEKDGCVFQEEVAVYTDGPMVYAQKYLIRKDENRDAHLLFGLAELSDESYSFSIKDKNNTVVPGMQGDITNSEKTFSNGILSHWIGDYNSTNFYVDITSGSCSGTEAPVKSYYINSSISTKKDSYTFCEAQTTIDVDFTIEPISWFIKAKLALVHIPNMSFGNVEIVHTFPDIHDFKNGTYTMPVVDGVNTYRILVYDPEETDMSNLISNFYLKSKDVEVETNEITPDDITVNVMPPRCEGMKGRIEANTDNGCGRLNYVWRDSNNDIVSFSGTAYNLDPGNYYLSIYDYGSTSEKVKAYENIISAIVPEGDNQFTVNEYSINGCSMRGQINIEDMSNLSGFTASWYYSETPEPDIINRGELVYSNYQPYMYGAPDMYVYLQNENLFDELDYSGIYDPYDYKALREGYYAVKVTSNLGCEETYESFAFQDLTVGKTYDFQIRWIPESGNFFPNKTSGGIPLDGDPIFTTPEITLELDSDESQNCIDQILANQENMIDEVAGDIEDKVVVSQDMEMSYFTLYYYDRIGNLVKTVPPKGVRKANNRIDDHYHYLQTEYKYNSLGQLIYQKTPDGGITHFAYDLLGRLLFSQNKQQLEDGRFSYTKYDRFGRIVESGESAFVQTGNNGIAITNFEELENYAQTYISNLGLAYFELDREEMFPSNYNNIISYTRTYYDKAVDGVALNGAPQENLKGNVSAIKTKDENNFESAIHYSYDVHGNVKWIATDVPEMGRTYTEYEYNLFTSNVTKVILHAGEAGKFYHRYKYDEDNRIANVETSFDGEVWNTEAEYDYYKHGPLRNVILGHEQVQEMNYRYTIHGWLKAINSNVDNNPNGNIPKDAFAMTLGYYQDDFKRTGSDLNGTNNGAQVALAKNMYSGNIAGWTWTSPNGSENLETKAYQYQYDYLQRIKSATFFENSGTAFNQTDKYKTNYTYDLNGNLRTLNRKGANGNVIDDLQYTYNNLDNNRLYGVTDNATGDGGMGDFVGEADYTYDKVGNLTSDENEDIAEIKWNAAGKITEIIPMKAADGELQKPHIVYSYDGMGNRILKQVNANPDFSTGDDPHFISRLITDVPAVTTTYYVRDASGKLLASFERENEERVTPENISLAYSCSDTEIPVSSLTYIKPVCVKVPPNFNGSYSGLTNVSASLTFHFADGTSLPIDYAYKYGFELYNPAYKDKRLNNVVQIDLTVNPICEGTSGTCEALCYFYSENQAAIKMTELPIYGSSRLGVANVAKEYGKYWFGRTDYIEYKFNNINRIENISAHKVGTPEMLIPTKDIVNFNWWGTNFDAPFTSLSVLKSGNVAEGSVFSSELEKQYFYSPSFTTSISNEEGNAMHAVVMNAYHNSIKLYGPKGTQVPFETKFGNYATEQQPIFTISGNNNNNYTLAHVANGTEGNNSYEANLLFSTIYPDGNEGLGSVGATENITISSDENMHLPGALAVATNEDDFETVAFTILQSKEDNSAELYRVEYNDRSKNGFFTEKEFILKKLFFSNLKQKVLSEIPATATEGFRLKISPDGKTLAVLYPSSKAQGLFPVRKHSVMLVPLTDGFSVGNIDDVIALEINEYANSKTISMEFWRDSKHLLIGQETMQETSTGETPTSLAIVDLSSNYISYSSNGGQLAIDNDGHIVCSVDKGGVSTHTSYNLYNGKPIELTFAQYGHASVFNAPYYKTRTREPYIFGDRTAGLRNYELTDHLGNVRAVLTDRKSDTDQDGTYDYELVQSSDYFPFGMEIKGLGFTKARDGYRFGFNGMEKEKELGEGNSYTTPFRQYDARIGRWLTMDPITHPWQGAYVAFNDNPIYYKDPSGLSGEGGDDKNTGTTNSGGTTHYSGSDVLPDSKQFDLKKGDTHENSKGDISTWDGNEWSDIAKDVELAEIEVKAPPMYQTVKDNTRDVTMKAKIDASKTGPGARDIFVYKSTAGSTIEESDGIHWYTNDNDRHTYGAAIKAIKHYGDYFNSDYMPGAGGFGSRSMLKGRGLWFRLYNAACDLAASFTIMDKSKDQIKKIHSQQIHNNVNESNEVNHKYPEVIPSGEFAGWTLTSKDYSIQYTSPDGQSIIVIFTNEIVLFTPSGSSLCPDCKNYKTIESLGF